MEQPNSLKESWHPELKFLKGLDLQISCQPPPRIMPKMHCVKHEAFGKHHGMRIFAVGDIHGRFDLLWDLWTQLLVNGLNLEVDKVIFLGDMIDRGLQVRQVVEFVRDLVENNPQQVVALRGNHEHFAIDTYTLTTAKQRDDERDNWCRPGNGGTTTLASFGGEVPHSVLDWFQSLPVSHEEPGFFFSHAPAPRENRRSILFRDTTPWTPFTEHELLWTYSEDEFGVARDFKDKVGVCGHIHKLRDGVFRPRFYPHYIFADSGSGCHELAPLCAIDVQSREVTYAWPQKAKQRGIDLLLRRM